MMEAILHLNAQLKEMKNEMDKLVHEEQASMEAAIATVIHIVTTTIPSILATSPTTAAPVATKLPTTSATASATSSTTTAAHLSDEASKLIKAMEDMSIQTNDINRLKE